MIRIAAAAVALLALVLAAGCGGSDDELFPRVITLGEGDVFPAISNSSLTVGPNRVSMTFTDTEDERLLGGSAFLEFYDLNDQDPVKTAAMPARFIPIELGYVDEQSDGAREVTGQDGVYVANVEFARAGKWGVKIRFEPEDGDTENLTFQFTVIERSNEPMVGDDAPPSRQATIANVSSIEEIDSSSPVRPAMHDVTVADAITAGRPAVVAFATPAFCTSRLCAPVMDTVMDPLYAEYSGDAAFIHIEPYVLRDLRNGFVENPVPAANEWRIHSEPWIFVIDRRGKVAAKFEGVIALDEVEMALEAALVQ